MASGSSSDVIGAVIIARHGDRRGYYQSPDTYTASDTTITPLGEVCPPLHFVVLSNLCLLARRMAARCSAPVDIPQRVLRVLHSGHRSILIRVQPEPGAGLCGQQRRGVGYHGQRGRSRPGTLAIHRPAEYDPCKWINDCKSARRLPIRTK